MRRPMPKSCKRKISDCVPRGRRRTAGRTGRDAARRAHSGQYVRWAGVERPSDWRNRGNPDPRTGDAAARRSRRTTSQECAVCRGGKRRWLLRRRRGGHGRDDPGPRLMLPIEFFFRAAAHGTPTKSRSSRPTGGCRLPELAGRRHAPSPPTCRRMTHGRIPVSASDAANSVEHLTAILACHRRRQDMGGTQSAQRRSRAATHCRISPNRPPLLIDQAMAARIDGRDIATFMLDGPPTDTVLPPALRITKRTLHETVSTARRHYCDQVHRRHIGDAQGRHAALSGWNANSCRNATLTISPPRDRYLVNAPLTHGASTYILPILGAGGAFVFPEDTKPDTLSADDCRARRDDVLFAAHDGHDAG